MKKITYLLTFTIISFLGCSGTAKSDNSTTPNKKISIIRFDKDIYNYLTQPDADKEKALKQKYPTLLPAFGRVAINNSDPETFYPTLKEYFSHPMLMQIYKDAISTFDDPSSYEEQLSIAEEKSAKYFPDKKLPQLAFHVSGFKENVIIINNLISISTDKYLGNNYAMYQDFFKPHERQQMQKEYIVRDFIKAWLMSDIIKTNTEEDTLLASIIKEGKILHCLSLLLPDYSADDIIGYNTTQSAWCKEKEKSVWQKIVKQDYLFSSDHMIITQIINDTPSADIIAKDTPGRIGCWIGWQIVRQFADKKNLSLEDIIKTNSRTILKDSKYNP